MLMMLIDGCDADNEATICIFDQMRVVVLIFIIHTLCGIVHFAFDV
jgi:hypothetical protein